MLNSQIKFKTGLYGIFLACTVMLLHLDFKQKWDG